MQIVCSFHLLDVKVLVRMSHTQRIIGNNNEARQTINQGSRTNNFNGQVGTVIGDGNVGSVSNPQYNKQKVDKGLYILDIF